MAKRQRTSRRSAARSVRRGRAGSRSARSSAKRTRSAKSSAPAGRTGAEAIVAELAHDIRTPLTGILALAELLAASELGERERAWATALRGNAEHLAALTTLVLDATKRKGRDIVIQQVRFDPQRLARSAAESLAARAQVAGLACDIDVAPDLPTVATGDPVRLRAALENLVDNAVKFTERGCVRFAAAIEKVARGRQLVFAVSDDGIGLTPTEIKRVFRPFAQANPGIARRFGGTGLGLALVKRLARAMGGDLTVESTPGRGSTFRLSVTLADSEDAAADRNADAAATTAFAPRANGGLRILCVEDNPYGRVVMNTILSNLGHHVDFASTGAAALEALSRAACDLVLMDVSLGDMDGFAVTRRIRARPGAAGRVPVIGISGHDEGSAATARQAGMDAYLEKPVGPRALAEAIAEVMAQPRA